MAGSFTLTLDTAPPANPALVINDGAAITGTPQVVVGITSTDYATGAHDLLNMKVWGDVDLTVDPRIQATESASSFQHYSSTLAVMLSAGAGRKRVFARLQDDVGNITIVFSSFIDYVSTVPVVTISVPVVSGRVSKVPPYDSVQFSWMVDRAFATYEVRVVSAAAAAAGTGHVVGSAFGSVGVSGSGSFASDTPRLTTIKGADLEAASPGNGPKILKIFARTSGGVWSV